MNGIMTAGLPERRSQFLFFFYHDLTGLSSIW